MNAKKLLMTAAVVVGMVQVASALPTLQLDIKNGVYVGDTTFAVSNPFELQAYLTDDSLWSKTFYLSAAIVPKAELTEKDAFGSFSINGIEYNGNNMTYGVPPVDDSLKDIAPHDVFATWYAEVSFTFDENSTVPAYNTGEPESVTGDMFAKFFNVDISELTPNVNNPDVSDWAVHFDLYYYDSGDKKIQAFAPFSHDAQSDHGITIHDFSPIPTPDGGITLLLLGSAMTGLGMLQRRIRK